MIDGENRQTTLSRAYTPRFCTSTFTLHTAWSISFTVNIDHPDIQRLFRATPIQFHTIHPSAASLVPAETSLGGNVCPKGGHVCPPSPVHIFAKCVKGESGSAKPWCIRARAITNYGIGRHTRNARFQRATSRPPHSACTSRL